MKELAGKTVIITGASSGIGKALALECLERDMQVVMAARNIEAMQQITSRFLPKQVLIVKADVSVQQDCKMIIQKCIDHFGNIDVLINNAGISMRALFEETQPEVLAQLMQVNFWGTAWCSWYALPHLINSKGSLVGISSIAGHKGLPARSGYSASKFAMQGLLETIRIENLKRGLHVLIACPGFTASNIRKTALVADGSKQGESPRDEQKMMSAELTAWHIMNAVAKRKRSLLLTTQGKITVLLNKLFPSWVDKQVYKHMAKEPDSPFK
jgi:short-subunit dehydrogenase